MYVKQYSSWAWDGPTWFNASAPLWVVFAGARRSLPVCLWTAFNRVCADGAHFWGFGILQIGHRHLFAVTHSGVSILFMGRIP